MLASQWVWQRTKSVSIPAEEQNAGRVVDYFYRMEFHTTPRFFSDSNYLFFLPTFFFSLPEKSERAGTRNKRKSESTLNKFCTNLSNKALDFYTGGMLPSTHKILVVRPNSPESARIRPKCAQIRPKCARIRPNYV